MPVPSNMARRPGLDGLRGVAILLVVLDHADFSHFRGTGGIGVTLFFCLSGFLITGLLLAEHETAGHVDLKRFYMRRARRLLPALVLLLVATILYWGTIAIPTAVVTLLYIANLPAAQDETTLFGPLHHMWSLAVEEQFYLVWPALLILIVPLLSRRRLAMMLALLALCAGVLRVVALPAVGYDWTYRATLPNLFPLVSGAAVAAMTRIKPVKLSYLSGVLGLTLLASLVLAPVPASNDWMIARTILTVSAAALLLGRDDRWMTSRPLRYCGRISYGWYLWHVGFQIVFGGFAGTVVSFLVASASWHLWESRWIARSPDPLTLRRPPSENPLGRAAGNAGVS